MWFVQQKEAPLPAKEVNNYRGFSLSLRCAPSATILKLRNPLGPSSLEHVEECVSYLE